MKEVRNSGIFAIDTLSGMPCVPHEIIPELINGTFSSPAKDRVARRICVLARINNAWVGVAQRKFLENQHGERESKVAFREAFYDMVDTGLLEIYGLKCGFWSWTNIFRRHIICPSKILILQIMRHQERHKPK